MAEKRRGNESLDRDIYSFSVSTEVYFLLVFDPRFIGLSFILHSCSLSAAIG